MLHYIIMLYYTTLPRILMAKTIFLTLESGIQVSVFTWIPAGDGNGLIRVPAKAVSQCAQFYSFSATVCERAYLATENFLG